MGTTCCTARSAAITDAHTRSQKFYRPPSLASFSSSSLDWGDATSQQRGRTARTRSIYSAEQGETPAETNPLGGSPTQRPQPLTSPRARPLIELMELVPPNQTDVSPRTNPLSGAGEEFNAVDFVGLVRRAQRQACPPMPHQPPPKPCPTAVVMDSAPTSISDVEVNAMASVTVYPDDAAMHASVGALAASRLPLVTVFDASNPSTDEVHQRTYGWLNDIKLSSLTSVPQQSVSSFGALTEHAAHDSPLPQM